jgi:two-component system LytT family sensor kinase
VPTPPLLPTHRLSARQKWRLAVNLFVISYPLLYYMFASGWDGQLLHALVWLLVHASTMLPFYFVWLYLAEWLLYRLGAWFGEDSVVELQPAAQFALFGLSLGLAVGFLAVWTRVLQAVQNVVLTWQGQPTYVAHSTDYTALFQRANNGFFLLLMLLVFYLLTNRQALLRSRSLHEHAQQLERAHVQGQLEALKSQVNPHFLFNSLSILSALVPRDADLATKYIEQLARVYRYTLEQRNHDLVALSTELEFIETYAFLLRLRFSDKFDLQLDLPTPAPAYRLAPLTLQLLVENAVKHNRMSVAAPLRIVITLEADELVVRNTLQRRPAAPLTESTGVGLQNIINRYRLLTPRPVRVSDTGPAFEVRIPLLP